eukprot:1013248-Pelagomonas_calceolata.AAC.4
MKHDRFSKSGKYLTFTMPMVAGIMQRAQDTPSPMKDPVVAEIASRLGWSPAQVGMSTRIAEQDNEVGCLCLPQKCMHGCKVDIRPPNLHCENNKT